MPILQGLRVSLESLPVAYSPTDLVVSRLTGSGFDPQLTGGGQYESRCPGHNGSRGNLSITTGDDGRCLVHCHHEPSCSPQSIVEALGLTLADLFPASDKPAIRARKPLGQPSATWVYHGLGGGEVLRVNRFDSLDLSTGKPTKTYRPQHRTSDGWRSGDPPGPLPLYRLTDLPDAETILVCEGEKVVEAVRKLGLIATTSAHGAGSPHKSDWTVLADKTVIVSPDHDQPGEAYGRKVLDLLGKLNPRPTAKVVDLPKLWPSGSPIPEGADLADWVELRHSQGATPEECRRSLESVIASTPAIDIDETSAQADSLSPSGDRCEPVEANSFVGFVGSSHECISVEATGFVGFVGSFPRVLPLAVTLRPVPELDERLLPATFRSWIKDIAERACCPLDLPAVASLVSVAAVVGRKISIRPKRHDDWTVVPNLWGMGVLPPGWLKTHCLAEPMKPLVRLESAARDAHAAALRDHARVEVLATARVEAAKAKLKERTKKGGATEAELQALAAEAVPEDALVPPTTHRYIVNDATVEKLGELLAENPNGLLMYRDELMGFLKNLEKPGHEGDRAFYLEAWNGTGSYSYDRIGRGSLFIQSSTVSLLGGIQPGKLAAYIRAAGSGENDDGLISRFQLAVYPDVDQPFVNVDRWPDTAAKNLAYAVFERLASLDPGKIGATADAPGEIPYLRFDDDAQAFFDGWRIDLETKIRSTRQAANLMSHLSKYRSLMPSLALLFHLIEAVSGQVSLTSARRSAAWCQYLEEHAMRIYAAAFDGDLEPAQRLGERLKTSLQNPFKAREVLLKGWRGLTTKEEVDRAISTLEAHGWVVRQETPATAGIGGRPTEVFHVSPTILEGGSEWTT